MRRPVEAILPNNPPSAQLTNQDIELVANPEWERSIDRLCLAFCGGFFLFVMAHLVAWASRGFSFGN